MKPHWTILIALTLATILAFVFRELPADFFLVTGTLATASFLGSLFMQLLKMIIVPLVFSSVVSGISGLHGVDGFGRLLGRTTFFYLFTSLLAILLGLFLVNTIQPGLKNGQANQEIQRIFQQQADQSSQETQNKITQVKTHGASQTGSTKINSFALQLRDFFKRMIPTNIIHAASQNGQMLGLIFFALLFALSITKLPSEHADPLRKFFQAFNEAMLLLTKWIMALAPIGIFGLILPVIYQTGGELFLQLGSYFLTVLLALALHLFITMPLIIALLIRRNPLAHFKAMRTALITAFSTASSAATLPITMHCVEQNARVSKRVSSFTLSLGSTVNMDGTALYECIAVLFVAQVMGVSMDTTAQFFVVITALLTSIGVAGIPSASLVAIFIILTHSGIPGAEMAIVSLLAVDRLLDMTRTAVNVFGDSCAALFVEQAESGQQ